MRAALGPVRPLVSTGNHPGFTLGLPLATGVESWAFIWVTVTGKAQSSGGGGGGLSLRFTLWASAA